MVLCADRSLPQSRAAVFGSGKRPDFRALFPPSSSVFGEFPCSGARPFPPIPHSPPRAAIPRAVSLRAHRPLLHVLPCYPIPAEGDRRPAGQRSRPLPEKYMNGGSKQSCRNTRQGTEHAEETPDAGERIRPGPRTGCIARQGSAPSAVPDAPSPPSSDRCGRNASFSARSASSPLSSSPERRPSPVHTPSGSRSRRRREEDLPQSRRRSGECSDRRASPRRAVSGRRRSSLCSQPDAPCPPGSQARRIIGRDRSADGGDPHSRAFRKA